eukprot:CAMPEP_0196762172 /NCGR_PEP_ID=MMETSP1095-20130614/1546_1 /TAXON_ID=96789 ORGANISM="Chromulina nebulosa, Strain UTEXLB2642" /NCGR_SAMPLE_ID=MMETSP1095 /ASSEMBLY_ACC=CAM_ASM_000446 /LENGTH=407 /DNA_ID=CAMNT_0042112601 /DNA_START=156 /DNA_END=1379 /DNA_ORIENTATION=-
MSSNPNSGEANQYYQGMDAYAVLGVPKTADQQQIKSAYRKLVAQWHPDKFPDNEAKKIEGGLRMERINRAYYVLSDEDRKRRYDKFGEAGVGTSAASEEQLKAAGGPGMGGFDMNGGGGVDISDMSDIFDAFFGGSGGRVGGRQQRQRNPNAPIQGDDIQIEVEIPFMTAIFGGQEKIRVRRLEECGTCNGSGIKPGAKVRSCSLCNGSGAVNNMQRTPFGVFSNLQTCPNCRGNGQEVEDYCSTCKGKGATLESKEVVMRVPAGVDSGSNLRIREAGNAGRRGGSRGDLFVQIAIKRDPKFKREGTDIYSEEDISYVDAILGTTIKADTVDGKMDVKVGPGTQPEQKLRIRGKGAPKLGTDIRGDAYITVKVKIPTNISGKEKELIEQIAELSEKKKTGGFFSGFG